MLEKKMVTSYSKGSKFFHWIIALIVILMLAGSFFLDDLPDSIKGTAFMLHKSFGLTVLALMLLRIIWIVQKGKPALPVTVPAWQRAMSRLVQYSLYFFVIVMPLSGWIMSTAAGRSPVLFDLVQLPLPGIAEDKALAKLMAEWHETIAFIIIGLLVLHIAGAAKHYFIDKDKVVQQML